MEDQNPLTETNSFCYFYPKYTKYEKGKVSINQRLKLLVPVFSCKVSILFFIFYLCGFITRDRSWSP